MMQRRLVLSALAAALLAGGCAAPLANAHTWKGRFALRNEKENLSGRFELTDAPDLLRLDLLTPLSGILARIEETSDGAVFMKSLSDPGIKGPNLEALMESLLGFTLPVHDLLALLRAGAAARDLSSRNWQCRILSRLPDGAPQRLRIERAAPNALQVTLFIDEAH
mgnify:FL=1